MTKTLLDSLKGLTVNDAEAKVKAEGLACQILEKGMARIMLAVSNTVFLYKDGDTVAYAESGDGVE
jgi:hypothetical protein